jgi:hypothetical protein
MYLKRHKGGDIVECVGVGILYILPTTKNMEIDNRNKPICWDCKKEIKMKGRDLVNGLGLVYEQDGKKINVFKCKKCFEDKSLRNYQPCEVYSRIVGYLRPLQQWNVGKKQEWQERVNYKET